MVQISLMFLSLVAFHLVAICGVKRNLYFPDHFHPFNTSDSQITGVFSSHCNYLKSFLTSTPVFTTNNSNGTKSIANKCVEVINPLYSALSEQSLKYDVYQHFVYYKLTELEIQQYQPQQNDNTTIGYNLVENNESLVYHLFFYNVSNYTHSFKSWEFWMNKLSNSQHFLQKVNRSQMIVHDHDSSVQSLVSNSIVFYVDDIMDNYGEKTNSFMYGECGATIRLKMNFAQHNELVKENQTVFITYSSDVLELPNHQIV